MITTEAFQWYDHVQLKMEQYLSSPILSVEQTKFLFHLRMKMLFLRTNYRNMQKEDYRPLCKTMDIKSWIIRSTCFNVKCFVQ